jgi:N-acylneuraminate cytidylyltransferase
VRVLALIPARGGSRGIPRKNLVPVGGQPLITWSIQAGRAAHAVDRVVVSTDDDEIAAVARAEGAEVPFRRPADLAGDRVTDLPVFQHALRWLAEHDGYRPDLVVHLRPTSPARREGLVDDAVVRLRDAADATSLRSVSRAAHLPHKMWWMTADGRLEPVCGTFAQELFNEPRQALPEAWVHDGVIDVVRTEVIEGGSMNGPRTLALASGPGEGIDIDAEDDLVRAEAALARLGRGPASGEGG